MVVSLIAFDVNQTLLDLVPLRDRLGGSTPVWFSRLLHGSLVANQLDAYRPFEEIGVEVLLAMSAAQGEELKEEEAREIVSIMTNLPAHPDVHPALEQLAAWLESPTLVLLSEAPGYGDRLAGLLRDGRVVGPQVHDARVAALCLHHGVEVLWTADRDFSRFPALRTQNPLIG